MSLPTRPTILPDAESLRLDAVAAEDGALTLVVSARRESARCPACGEVARKVHSRYTRTLADLPCFGLPTRVRLRARRWFCRNPGCARRIFTERLPAVAAPHARRTERLAALALGVALAHGGEAGASILRQLGVRVSGATLLATVRRTPATPPPVPARLGVDDWALRRGARYATILVDLERHAPIALLPDRSATGFGRWLEEHPGVRVICRDRAGDYAAGGELGAPAAVQVTDRWHLIRNAGDALERVLGHHRQALREAAAALDREVAGDRAAEPSAPAPREEPAGSPGTAPAPSRADHRLANYQAVLTLRDRGLSITAIAARVGLSRPTVRKYLHAGGFPVWAPRRRKLELRPGDVSYLRERWAAGCRDGVALHAELRGRGYRGSLRSVQRHIAAWRPTALGPDGAPGGPPPFRAPSPRQARWWLLQPDAQRTALQRGYLERLEECCPAVRAATALASAFIRLVRERDAAGFLAWLMQAEASDLREFRDFAAGLRRDQPAVEAALRLPWSNGQTEGQITKLKLLKRQGYGRQKLDLLQRRLVSVA